MSLDDQFKQSFDALDDRVYASHRSLEFVRGHLFLAHFMIYQLYHALDQETQTLLIHDLEQLASQVNQEPQSSSPLPGRRAPANMGPDFEEGVRNFLEVIRGSRL